MTKHAITKCHNTVTTWCPYVTTELQYRDHKGTELQYRDHKGTELQYSDHKGTELQI
jgi:hypothetical protein